MDDKWSKKNILRLLQAYREEKVLWDIHQPSDDNQVEKSIKREEAYLNIFRKLSIPGLTPQDVETKILKLKRLYFITRKKVMMSIPLGIPDGEPTYVPWMFWYDKADAFLRENFNERFKRTIQREPVLNYKDKKQQLLEYMEKEKEYCSPPTSSEKIDKKHVQNFYLDLSDNSISKTTDVPTKRIQHKEKSNTYLNRKSFSRTSTENSKEMYDDDDFPRRYLPHKPVYSYSRAKKTLNLAKKSIKHETKFDLFGKQVAIQLRKMPAVGSLALMQKLQAVINQHKLELANRVTDSALPTPGD